jgi:hypothetical protein
MLEARTRNQNLSKRAPQSVEEVFTMIGSFFNYITSFTAPLRLSRVPDIQEEPSATWSGAKRKKIRYGPHRVPPTSVKPR